MGKLIPGIVLHLLCGMAFSQTPSSLQANITTGGLFGLASKSDLIVIGEVISDRGIGKRLTPEQIRDLDDLSKTLGGRLFTVQVESIVCCRTDFEPGTPRPQPADDKLFIFQSYDTPMYRGPFRRPDYFLKQRYLLLLTPLPEQDRLPLDYMLDAGQTYYEAVNGEKGVIPLSDEKHLLLNKLKRLCEAVRPADLQAKLKRLRELRRSPDPDLRQGAEDAIRFLTRKQP